MSPREATLLWLRDTLDSLMSHQQQLEWTEDPAAVRLLTETMLRDLERCQRLTQALHQRAAVTAVRS